MTPREVMQHAVTAAVAGAARPLTPDEVARILYALYFGACLADLAQPALRAIADTRAREALRESAAEAYRP